MVTGSALGLAGCNAIFGMDAPTLNPCVNGCSEGGLDEGTGDDSTMPGPEASTDAGTVDSAKEGAQCETEAGVGVRCGGGAFPTSWCNGCAPVCCQGGSASAPTFTCVASMAACSGYTIECADYNDCSGSDVCCRFMAHQICDAPANCPNNELVCDNAAPQTCPNGPSTCDVPFVGDASASSPYLGCSP
jgi:hypothetical protein